eukprot:sb/3468710/
MSAFTPDSLVTPSPYHIPGYGGYIPQRKYKIGGTFSKTTHEILTEDDISSGNLVLRKIEPVRESHPRIRSNLVPGYTGYIPHGENWFGLPYVVACSHAKGDYKDAQAREAKERRRMRQVQVGAFPLPPARGPAEPYVGRRRAASRVDYHISGYTGFLPMSRNKISMGYPKMTEQAISDYREQERRQAAMKLAPKQPNEHVVARPIMVRREVYPKASGMVPHYTGHIPGEKFRYGNTFGMSTDAALRSMNVS